MPNRFKIEVRTDLTNTWNGNAMVYGTFKDAEDAAVSLAYRWLLVRKSRVVEFDQNNEVVKTTIVFEG